MRIIQKSNYEEMSKEAFNIIAETLKNNKQSNINTTTGASYDGVFELLVEAINHKELSIEEAVIMNLDEYIAEREKSFTVYTYMHKKFYELINSRPSFVGLLDGSVKDVEAEIKRYQALLKNYPTDLQILGLGMNAHLGANEPGTSFDSRLFLANSDESTIQSSMLYHNLTREEAPTQMLTLGLADIMEAKQILLTASGVRKAQAVKATIEGSINEITPASILKTHPNVTFIIDDAAASLL